MDIQSVSGHRERRGVASLCSISPIRTDPLIPFVNSNFNAKATEHHLRRPRRFGKRYSTAGGTHSFSTGVRFAFGAPLRIPLPFISRARRLEMTRAPWA